MTQRQVEIDCLLEVISNRPSIITEDNWIHSSDICIKATIGGCSECCFYGGEYPDMLCRLDIPSYSKALIDELYKIIPEKFL